MMHSSPPEASNLHGRIITDCNCILIHPFVYVPVNSSRIVLLCIFSTCTQCVGHALFVHAPLVGCPIGDCTWLYLRRAYIVILKITHITTITHIISITHITYLAHITTITHM